MGDPGFPVRIDDVPARISFGELGEGMVVSLADDLIISCARLNHPGGVLAYRIQYQDHALVYATDTEHYSVPDPKLVRLASADVLIYDAQYDDAEYSGETVASRAPAGATARSAKESASPTPRASDSLCYFITIRATATIKSRTSKRRHSASDPAPWRPAKDTPLRLLLPRRNQHWRSPHERLLIPYLAMPRAPRKTATSGAENSSRSNTVDRRSVLLALLELIRTEVDLDTLLRRIVDLLAQAMDADRATLFVVDKPSGELISRAAHLPELPEIRLRLGQGIAGLVAQTQNRSACRTPMITRALPPTSIVRRDTRP